MTERVNHERVCVFLCKWQRAQRVIPQYIYLAVMSFIGEEVMDIGHSLTGEEFCGNIG